MYDYSAADTALRTLTMRMGTSEYRNVYDTCQYENVSIEGDYYLLRERFGIRPMDYYETMALSFDTLGTMSMVRTGPWIYQGSVQAYSGSYSVTGEYCQKALFSDIEQNGDFVTIRIQVWKHLQADNPSKEYLYGQLLMYDAGTIYRLRKSLDFVWLWEKS